MVTLCISFKEIIKLMVTVCFKGLINFMVTMMSVLMGSYKSYAK